MTGAVCRRTRTHGRATESPTVASHHPCRRDRGQSGASLIEVLIASALGAMIIVPVFMWMATAFRAEATVKTTVQRTRLVSQITQALPRDVSESTGVLYTHDDGDFAASGVTVPSGCLGDGSAERVAVVIASTANSYVVYSVEPDGGGTNTITRRSCNDAGATGLKVLGRAVPGNPDLLLRSTSRVGGAFPTTTIRSVDLTVSIPNSREVTVTGSRRVGIDGEAAAEAVGP